MGDSKEVVIDACCVINLFAAGDLPTRLEVIGGEWHVPSAVVAEALYIHKKKSEGDVEKIEINIQSLIDGNVLALCTTENELEIDLYVDFATQVDDGEAMALAIAKCRSWTVATDDRVALRLARENGIAVLTTPDLIKRWADASTCSTDELKETLTRIETLASFFPPKSHPLKSWWRDAVDD